MKKNYKLLTFAVTAFLILAIAGGASAFSGGDGSSGNPYQISNCVELQEMNNNLNASYVLINDIDCSDSINWNSGAGFVSIGNSSSRFTGTFDGQGHKITGLFINRPSSNTLGYVGLFGYTESGAIIKNIGLVDVNITSRSAVGGGLVGNNSGTITNSYATGIISNSNVGGGLVGNNSGTITNSYATGSVIGISSSYVGGLVGNNSGTITNSYATGSVAGNDSSFVGGLVGANYALIINSYATGSVTGSNYVGGLVGLDHGVIANSYWDMETSGQSTSAGGTGKTTIDMMQQSTFVGWDFTNIWGINENVSYPYFSWQTPPADTIPPVAPNAPDLQVASDTGLSSTDNITNDNTPSFDITGLESNSTVTVYANGNILGTIVIPDGYTFGTFTTAIPMDEGTYVITATQTDAAGNAGPISPAMAPNLVIDKTPPVITVHADVTVEATSAAGAVVTYDLPTATDNYDTIVTVTCTPASGSTFPLGDTTVTCTATDLAGNNTSLATAKTIQVVDSTPPVITTPPTNVVVGDVSSDGAVVNYILPTATDNYDENVTVTCNYDTGSIFPLGDTLVTCVATDSLGNSTPTTFVVHVVDTTPPVIADHANVTVEATSVAGASVTYISPATTDNVDGAGAATCTPASGGIFALGNTTVTCNAEDAAGNHATPTTFTVTVQDKTAPTIKIITPEPYGLYTIGTALNFFATDDQSDIASVVGNLVNTLGTSIAVQSGYVPEPGVYSLVVTATDNAGNSTTSDTINFVVYDPSGGFATGGGWFYPDSESNLSSAGKANFGFNAKYKDSSSTGNLEFQYKSGPDINLKSTAIDWLVISGVSAQFQGTGTINGTGFYTFRVTAKDNAEPGIGADHFDITIWEGVDTTKELIYKAKNTLSGGNIVIHKK